jgi:hypothetical protein
MAHEILNTTKSTELDSYLEVFYKKYKEYYSPFYKTQTDSNADNTKTNKAIFERINNIYNFFILKKVEPLQKNAIESTLKDAFIKDMMLRSLLVNRNPNAIPKKMNLLIYHGTPYLHDHVRVPAGCIIVILTPIGRLGMQSNYDELLKNIQDPNEFKNFMENPLCYKRNELNGIYSDASIYFPGQYYFDIILTGEPDPSNLMHDYWGNYTYDVDTAIKPIRDQSLPRTMISAVIKTKKLQGVIIVHCCRSLNSRDIRSFDLNHSIVMKQYETFIQILNKCVYFASSDPKNSEEMELDDESYNDCDKIIDFDPKYDSGCIKSINYYGDPKRSYYNSEYVENYKPFQEELNQISKNYTDANSESKKLESRITIGLGLNKLEKNIIIQTINTWWCSHDPSIDGMDKLFENLTVLKFSKKDQLNDDDILCINILFKLPNSKLLHEKYIIIREIFLSYLLFFFITTPDHHLFISLDNLKKIYPVYYKGLSSKTSFNVFLNGLNITTGQLSYYTNHTSFFSTMNANVYLRHNKLVGIPQKLLIINIDDIKKNKDPIKPYMYSYNVFDLTGNPLDLTMKSISIDGVISELADIDFLKKHYIELVLNNQKFMKQMLILIDQTPSLMAQMLAPTAPTAQTAGYKYRKIRHKTKRNIKQLNRKTNYKTKRIYKTKKI